MNATEEKKIAEEITSRANAYTWKLRETKDSTVYLFKSNSVGVLEYSIELPYHDAATKRVAGIMFAALVAAEKGKR